MNNITDIMQLCDIVRQTSYAIHVYHGHGHLEKVYETPWLIGCAKSVWT